MFRGDPSSDDRILWSYNQPVSQNFVRPTLNVHSSRVSQIQRLLRHQIQLRHQIRLRRRLPRLRLLRRPLPLAPAPTLARSRSSLRPLRRLRSLPRLLLGIQLPTPVLMLRDLIPNPHLAGRTPPQGMGLSLTISPLRLSLRLLTLVLMLRDLIPNPRRNRKIQTTL